MRIASDLAQSIAEYEASLAVRQENP